MSAPAPSILPAPADQPVKAILTLLAANLVFTSMDGFVKALAGAMATEQIILSRYVFATVVLIPVLWAYRADRPLATGKPAQQIARGLALFVSATLFTVALGHLPLETATAIGFVAPLYVTALSILFLGEQVGVRRWSAVGVGFLGVMVILRPGGEAFQPAMLIPLASSFCWACALILTRLMRGTERPLTILAWSTATGLVAVLPFGVVAWRAPTASEWAILAAVGLCSMAGQYLTIRAFLIGSASMLAPFSYSTIVWATLIGAVFFASFPDAATIAGTMVLVAAGLYVWHRERVREVPPTVPGNSIAEAAEELRLAELETETPTTGQDGRQDGVDPVTPSPSDTAGSPGTAPDRRA